MNGIPLIAPVSSPSDEFDLQVSAIWISNYLRIGELRTNPALRDAAVERNKQPFPWQGNKKRLT